jgi:S1-C subfamily serine protease
MRPAAIAAISLVSAVVGGALVLLVADASGWRDGGSETVVVPAAEPIAPALPQAIGGGARPLAGNGFDPRAIYARRAGGVVTVYALFGDHAETGEASQGSGFVVSRDGLVLTSAHVITTAGSSDGANAQGATRAYVELRDGERLEARVVGWDVFDDVGVLRIRRKPPRLRPIPLGDSDRVRVGDPVAAIGSPFGEQTSLSVGVISATRRSISALTSPYAIVDAIQIDAPLNRGNSGGPLLDADGRAIGINAQIRTTSGNAEGVGFAVPIDAARRSLRQLLATGRVLYAYAGVGTDDLTPSVARRLGLGPRRGALITRIDDSGPADRAGLRGSTRTLEVGGESVLVGGDVVVAVGDHPVRSSTDLVRIVTREFLPGQVARFHLLRSGRRVVVGVRLAQRPRQP